MENGQTTKAAIDGSQTKRGGKMRQARPFGLIDVESGNMVGSYASEPEALSAVAQTARQFGPASNAVLSLSLFRDDVPPDQGFIADGADLVRLALTAAREAPVA